MKTVLKLDVTWHGRKTGTIQQAPEGDHCVFEYDKQWLAEGFALSPLELPLQSGLFHADPDAFGGGFAVFEDSLPDGYGLYLLDRILRRQGSSLKELSVLQRLALVGDRGMGALCYTPGSNLLATSRNATVQELDLLQQQALNVLSERDCTDDAWLYYNSGNSGGARPKALIHTADDRHLVVKFRHVDDPADIGQTEYIYTNTARNCGIEVPHFQLLGGKYFASERFDIREGQRLHVLTAAALLKTDFRRQDVDYKNLLALTGYLTQDPVQVEQMFRRMVFNVVAINKDDHAKNFSFIHDGQRWSLAPAYDLTYSPMGTRGEHSTSILYSGNPTLQDILTAGEGIRIQRRRCLEIVEEIQRACQAALPHTKALL